MTAMIPSLAAAVLVLIGQHSQMPLGMSHEEHLKQIQKEEALKKRGKDAMGFDQDMTAHHFKLSPAGGSIEVTVREQADRQNLEAIRSHLKSIAAEFADGLFDKPFQTHAEVPPGVTEMQKSRQSITYRYEDLPQGGAVRIKAADARTIDAVHTFLRYQITEHRTGDPLQPE